MKKYTVLKDFIGSQTGSSEPEVFLKGEIATISAHLSAVALRDGSIEAYNKLKPEETKIVAPLESKPSKSRGKKKQ